MCPGARRVLHFPSHREKPYRECALRPTADPLASRLRRELQRGRVLESPCARAARPRLHADGVVLGRSIHPGGAFPLCSRKSSFETAAALNTGKLRPEYTPRRKSRQWHSPMPKIYFGCDVGVGALANISSGCSISWTRPFRAATNHLELRILSSLRIPAIPNPPAPSTDKNRREVAVFGSSDSCVVEVSCSTFSAIATGSIGGVSSAARVSTISTGFSFSSIAGGIS